MVLTATPTAVSQRKGPGVCLRRRVAVVALGHRAEHHRAVGADRLLIGKPLPSVPGEATFNYVDGYIRLPISPPATFWRWGLLAAYRRLWQTTTREIILVPVWINSGFGLKSAGICSWAFTEKYIGHSPVGQIAMASFFVDHPVHVRHRLCLYGEARAPNGGHAQRLWLGDWRLDNWHRQPGRLHRSSKAPAGDVGHCAVCDGAWHPFSPPSEPEDIMSSHGMILHHGQRFSAVQLD